MRSNIWMFCILVFMLFVAPVLIILTAVGSAGVSFGTILMYWFPAAFCAAIVASLLFHRQSQRRNEA